MSENIKINEKSIGYCIGKNWWNSGITTEALKAVIKYLVDEVGVSRIEGRHSIENPSSGKVMEKAGLKFEGVLRKKDYSNYGVTDLGVYSFINGVDNV